MKWWRSFEEELAQHGERVSRSGAGEFEKLDLRLFDFLVDAKTSQQQVKAGNSFRITKKEWENTQQKAKWEGKLPAMINQLDEHRIFSMDYEDAIALQTELEELRQMRVVAKRPRLDKKDQELIEEPDEKSYFFKRLADHWQQEQEIKKDGYEWKGRISPSAKIYPRMCIKKFFEQNIKFVEMGTQGLRSARLGNILHRGIFEYSEDVEHLLFPFPEFGNNLFLKNLFNQIRPEIPVDCEETGFRGHIDQVIAIPADGNPIWPQTQVPCTKEGWKLTWDSPFLNYYQPVVTDLKTTARYKTAKQWNAFVKKGRPENTHRGQVLVYMYFLRKYPELYYQDIVPTTGCVAYLNVTRPDWFAPGSYAEFYFPYEPWRECMDSLIPRLAEQRLAYLEGKSVKCHHRWCSVHGDK